MHESKPKSKGFQKHILVCKWFLRLSITTSRKIGKWTNTWVLKVIVLLSSRSNLGMYWWNRLVITSCFGSFHSLLSFLSQVFPPPQGFWEWLKQPNSGSRFIHRHGVIKTRGIFRWQLLWGWRVMLLALTWTSWSSRNPKSSCDCPFTKKMDSWTMICLVCASMARPFRLFHSPRCVCGVEGLNKNKSSNAGCTSFCYSDHLLLGCSLGIPTDTFQFVQQSRSSYVMLQLGARNCQTPAIRTLGQFSEIWKATYWLYPFILVGAKQPNPFQELRKWRLVWPVSLHSWSACAWTWRFGAWCGLLNQRKQANMNRKPYGDNISLDYWGECGSFFPRPYIPRRHMARSFCFGGFKGHDSWCELGGSLSNMELSIQPLQVLDGFGILKFSSPWQRDVQSAKVNIHVQNYLGENVKQHWYPTSKTN